jgi:23S rRNA (cytidine2498-2'-O)-methyltransferase
LPTWLGLGKLTRPFFLRHICPIHQERRLAEGSLAELRLDGEMLAAIDPALSFSVQTRLFGEPALKPFQVNETLAEQVIAAVGSPLQVKDPQQVISVVILAQPMGIRAWLGLSLAAQNLSNWAGGIHRFRRDPEQISRSEFKLLEAIQVFQIPLVPGGQALDLGAAPGGWSRILRLYGQQVTAVDPGDLDERLSQDPGIRHHCLSAQAYLARGPGRFHLILNDMRMDGPASAPPDGGFCSPSGATGESCDDPEATPPTPPAGCCGKVWRFWVVPSPW